MQRAIAEAEAEMLDTTPELSSFILSLQRSASVSPKATLKDLRAAMLDNAIYISPDGELQYPQDRTWLVIELDELIEQHGAQVCITELKIAALN